jgi:hypothetical protein
MAGPHIALVPSISAFVFALVGMRDRRAHVNAVDLSRLLLPSDQRAS